MAVTATATDATYDSSSEFESDSPPRLAYPGFDAFFSNIGDDSSADGDWVDRALHSLSDDDDVDERQRDGSVSSQGSMDNVLELERLTSDLAKQVSEAIESMEVTIGVKEKFLAEREKLKKLVDERKENIRRQADTVKSIYHNQKNELIRNLQERREAVKTNFKKKKDEILAKGKSQRDQFIAKHKSNLEKRKQKLKEVLVKAETPLFMRLIDKINFTASVCNVTLTEFVMLKYPELMPYYYSVCMIPLLFIRFFVYHKSKYHYFLLDFCYFVQCMLMFYIYFYPHHPVLFNVLFAWSNGPLAWAIVLWRNGMVFHSLDKVTSSLIHVLPMCVTFCLRWYTETETFQVCQRDSCRATPYESIILPCALYFVWQLAYYLKTEVVDKEKLDEDPDIQTSLRWLMRGESGAIASLRKKCDNVFGVGARGFMFMFFQFLYTVVSVSLTSVMFHSYRVNVAFVIFICVFCVWNAAQYYMEVFSRRYQKKLEAEVIKIRDHLLS